MTTIDRHTPVPTTNRPSGQVLAITVGRIYQQTFIDTYAKVAFAKLYDRKTPITAAAKVAFAKLYDHKTPITAAEILNDRVVPF